MQKKVIFLSLLVLVVVVVILAYIYIPRNTKDEVCNPYVNLEADIKSGNIKSCDCLQDDSLVGLCKKNINSSILFDQALEKADSSLCEGITKLDMKDSCLRAVAEKKEFLKNNPSNLFINIED